MATANGGETSKTTDASQDSGQHSFLSSDERRKLAKTRSNSSHVFVHANDALFNHYQGTGGDDAFSRNIFKNPSFLKILARGTVFRVIWAEWIGHTLWALLVVLLSKYTPIYLGISNVLLTVLGVLIGFVVPYRVSASYNNYWLGRSVWGDLMRHSRTLARLIWFNVPTCTRKYGPDETVPKEELQFVLEEKKAFLDLILAFATAVKHRLRSEHGIYYDDLYPLVCDMPQFNRRQGHKTAGSLPLASQPTIFSSASSASTTTIVDGPTDPNLAVNSGTTSERTPVFSAPPAEYGTFEGRPIDPKAPPILPGHPHAQTSSVPILSNSTKSWALWGKAVAASQKKRVELRRDSQSDEMETVVLLHRKFKEFKTPIEVSSKHIPRMDDLNKGVKDENGNDTYLNIPLEIIWSLSAYLYVLEKRNNVGGNPLGQLYANVLALEDDLTTMEKILTCPLPVIYALHLRHTVWIYLLFLPLQLLPLFDSLLTVFGTSVAAFFFLGFVAAGEEIEQPFGYDDNDLDLDLFVEDIIGKELLEIKDHLPPDVAEGFKEIEKQEDNAAKWMRKRRKWKVGDIF